MKFNKQANKQMQCLFKAKGIYRTLDSGVKTVCTYIYVKSKNNFII